MRKLIVAAAAVVALSSTAVAQGGGGGGAGGPGRGGMNPAQMKEMYFAGITLSAEQNVKVDSIMKKYADLNAAIPREDTERRTKVAANRTKQTEELKAVLTDDQKKVFEKTMADMAARMQGGGGRPPLK
jgi:Spy/CpxP family protein refolding chaperone